MIDRTVSNRRAVLWLVTTVAVVVGMTCAILGGIDGASTVAAAGPRLGATPSGSMVEFTSDGELKRPEGYRKWIYVGAPITPNEMNDGKAPFPEFHSVYIDPNSFAVFEETGEFPNGTVMVKELVDVGHKEAASGHGYFMGEFIGLEASIKDETRFEDAPGGWAYFSFGHKYPLKEKARPHPAISCNACHEANAAHDLVFTQYYPVLRAARISAKAK